MNDPLLRVTGLTADAFAASYWGIAPLLRSMAQLPEGGFADLFSLAAVDELVSRRGLRTPFMRMSIDGNVLPASRFTRSGGAGAEVSDQVADDKILAEFVAGATLVLQGLHRTWSPVQDFASAFSTQLGHPIQVNAYVTPPQNVGFSPHYDVHDVFVIQFAGRKHWRIHEPVLASPLRDQPWSDRKSAVAARAKESPLVDTILECGDVLYLPRGYIHSAASLGEISGHLTVGVHPITRGAILDTIFASVTQDEALRRSLPMGVDLADETVLAPELEHTVAALHHAIDRIDSATIARAVARHLATATRPAALGPLEQWSAAATLTSETRVRLRTGLRVSIRNDGDQTCIELPDKTVRSPISSAEAVRIASGESVAAVDLASIDIDEALTLLARLLREGVVVPA